MSILPAHRIDHAAAVRVLGALGGMLDELDVPWWIDYGTVLGAARDGGVIAWDSDIDIGVFARDRERVTGLATDLRAHGFRTCYHQPGPSLFRSGDWFHVIAGRGNPNGVDVFFWDLRDDGLYHRDRYADIDKWKGREFPPDRLLPLQRIEWEGLSVSAPADIEWFAEHRYGPAWRKEVRTEDYVSHLKAQGRVE